ncbi:MAG: cytochrome c [Chitinophagales bacterium]|nr:cytochrome c [Chitinophagales bacterium]
MDKRKLDTISLLSKLSLFIIILLLFGFSWGEFKRASKLGISGINDDENMVSPYYKTGNTAIGQHLFQTKCQRCHIPYREFTGPDLIAVKDRWPDSTNLYKWIRNSQGYLQETNDPYATSLYKKYNSVMPAFPELSDADITQILYYVSP